MTRHLVLLLSAILILLPLWPEVGGVVATDAAGEVVTDVVSVSLSSAAIAVGSVHHSFRVVRTACPLTPVVVTRASGDICRCLSTGSPQTIARAWQLAESSHRREQDSLRI